MRMSDILTRELDGLRRHLGRPLEIVETGAIRNPDPAVADDDGWSTLTLALGAQAHGDSVISIDLDTTAAAAVLNEHHLGGRVQLIRGHSIDYLARLLGGGARLDVVLLDSANDPVLILHEYLIARQMLRRAGLLFVDDVDPGSETVVKGQALVPWLNRQAVDFRMERRSGPTHSTSMLIVGEPR